VKSTKGYLSRECVGLLLVDFEVRLNNVAKGTLDFDAVKMATLLAGRTKIVFEIISWIDAVMLNRRIDPFVFFTTAVCITICIATCMDW
jgi:hypothetical protein